MVRARQGTGSIHPGGVKTPSRFTNDRFQDGLERSGTARMGALTSLTALRRMPAFRAVNIIRGISIVEHLTVGFDFLSANDAERRMPPLSLSLENHCFSSSASTRAPYHDSKAKLSLLRAGHHPNPIRLIGSTLPSLDDRDAGSIVNVAERWVWFELSRYSFQLPARL